MGEVILCLEGSTFHYATMILYVKLERVGQGGTK